MASLKITSGEQADKYYPLANRPLTGGRDPGAGHPDPRSEGRPKAFPDPKRGRGLCRRGFSESKWRLRERREDQRGTPAPGRRRDHDRRHPAGLLQCRRSRSNRRPSEAKRRRPPRPRRPNDNRLIRAATVRKRRMAWPSGGWHGQAKHGG